MEFSHLIIPVIFKLPYSLDMWHIVFWGYGSPSDVSRIQIHLIINWEDMGRVEGLSFSRPPTHLLVIKFIHFTNLSYVGSYAMILANKIDQRVQICHIHPSNPIQSNRILLLMLYLVVNFLIKYSMPITKRIGYIIINKRIILTLFIIVFFSIL